MEHWALVEEMWEAGSVIVSGRSGGLPMGSAAVKSKLPLIFPLLDPLAGSDEPDGELISGLIDGHEALAGLPDSWSDRLKGVSTCTPEPKSAR